MPRREQQTRIVPVSQLEPLSSVPSQARVLAESEQERSLQTSYICSSRQTSSEAQVRRRHS